jgi:aryl-alcohol dehydrogenase-like predicted oxidoreductase
MLTGRYTSPIDFEEGDWRFFSWFSAGSFGGDLLLVEALRRVVGRKGCTVGQLYLAWLLAQGEDVFLIP